MIVCLWANSSHNVSGETRVSCTNCTPQSLQRYRWVPLKLPFFLVRFEPQDGHFFCMHTLGIEIYPCIAPLYRANGITFVH